MRINTAFVSCLAMLCGCQTVEDPGSPGGKERPVEVNLVNAQATPETRSLFAYLRGTGRQGILFGHQNNTSQGLTITRTDGTESDTLNAVGDFSAIYGLGTHNIVPPKWGGDITDHAKLAYERGGIITVFTLWDNPLTYENIVNRGIGKTGTAWDRTPAVASSLPGGAVHEIYRGWMDGLADWALSLKDEGGRPIPIMFRILHENTGDWFWWGAAQCSPEEYIQLFRYTVDYLVKVRKVNNLLFCYCPSTHQIANVTDYLERYPGDDWVDILSFSAYGPVADNEAWFQRDVVDFAAMVVQMAEERGKVAAMDEVGISYADIEKGLYDNQWYRKLMNGLKSNEQARRLAYLLVWRNGNKKHYWVPTTLPEHIENGTLEDFREFYADPLILFNRDISGVYSIPTVELDL